MYAVFVYSPRFEGVHCAARKVCPGWFALVQTVRRITAPKSWMVKGTSKVKNAGYRSRWGAKGGFGGPAPLPLGGNRDEIQQEAIAPVYRLFHQGAAGS